MILDLYCGAGGAAMGLHQGAPNAEIVGVDIKPQKHYPFTFVQADALEYSLEGFDFIWASPPCQRYTCLRSVFDSSKYAYLIEVTRARLDASNTPYVLENVVGAPLRRDLMLCAAPFGLRSYRHRIFEANFQLDQPEHPKHAVPVNRRKKNRRGHWDAGGFVTVVGDIGSYVGPEALGIDWMTGHELSQAIPPAYSRYIMDQFLTARKEPA